MAGNLGGRIIAKIALKISSFLIQNLIFCENCKIIFSKQISIIEIIILNIYSGAISNAKSLRSSLIKI